MRFTNAEELSILERSKALPAISSMSLDVFTELQKRYSEPHRRYHDWNHILSVLSWVNHVYDLPVQRHVDGCSHLEMSLAALFHDAVYEIGKGSPLNEAESIHLLRSFKIEGATDKVEEMILATARHGKTIPSMLPDYVKVFLDCDIASFGEMRWEIFLATDDSIVEEYELHYPKEQVAEGRKKFLGSMIAADRRIFMSDHFGQRFEQQAEDNIRRLIKRKYGGSNAG